MMTGPQFSEWCHRMGFTKKEAARRLSVGKNTPKDWEDGKVPIPEEVDLLCAAIALNVRPYSEYPPSGINGRDANRINQRINQIIDSIEITPAPENLEYMEIIRFFSAFDVATSALRNARNIMERAMERISKGDDTNG